MKTLRAICAIACYEWKLQIRGLSFWVIVFLLALRSIAPYISHAGNTTFSPIELSGIGEGLSTFLSLLLVFPVADALNRDRRNRAKDLIWSTSVTASIYIGGKILGLLAMLCTMVFIHTTGQFLVCFPHYLSLESLMLYAKVVMVRAIPTLTYVTCLYLCLTALLPRPLYLYPLAIAYWLLTLIAFGSITDILNYSVSTVFTSDMIVLGPDWPMLLANRAFYLAAGLCLVVLTIYIYLNREGRSVEAKYGKWVCNVLLIGGLCLLGWALFHFKETIELAASSSGEPFSLWSDGGKAPTEVQTVAVEATVYPDRGIIEGMATFGIASAMSRPVSTFSIQMPPGFRVKTVRESRTGLQPDWKQVNDATLLISMPTQLHFGETIALVVEYAGRFQVRHVDYQRYGTHFGYVPGYIGQDMVYLKPEAWWYPIVEGGSGHHTNGPHEVKITVPKGFVAVASTELKEQTATGVTYHWSSSAGWPQVALAATSHYVLLDASKELYSYGIPGHRDIVVPFAVRVNNIVNDMDRLVGKQRNALVIAEVPLTKRIAYCGNLLLLPEELLLPHFRLGRETFGELKDQFGGLNNDLVASRDLAEHVIRQWWLGQIQFADPTFPGWPQLPGGPTPPQHNLLLEGLTGYFTSLLADLYFDENLMAREMSIRQQLAVEAMDSPHGFVHDQQQRLSEFGLGSSPSSYNTRINQIIATLAQLRERAGKQAFDHTITYFLQSYSGGQATLADFQEIVAEVCGEALAKLFDPYLDMSYDEK